MTEVIEKYINSDTTVISFSGVGNNPDGKINSEFFNLTKFGYNVLFIIDTNRSWFNDIDYNLIIKKIKTEKVYCLGNSMGAFNATMFSLFYPVNKVLGFVPQYSVYPDIVPWETRWKKYIDNIKNWKYKEMQFNAITEYLYICSNNSEQDKLHMDMIPDKNNIKKVFLNHKFGHTLANKLKSENRLYPIITDFFEDRINGNTF